MDPYIRGYVQAHVHVDSGQRVWLSEKGKAPVELTTFMSGPDRKVVLPISKIAFTFEDLKKMGARVDVVTLRSLAKMGGEGRWRERIEARRNSGLPSNVYIANARSVEYAISKNRTPPPIKYVGRSADRMTLVYDTVDEVVEAMDNDRWRTEFSRGRHAKRK